MPDEFDDVFDAEAWHHGRPTHPDRPFSVSVAMLLLRSLRGSARRDVSSGR